MAISVNAEGKGVMSIAITGAASTDGGGIGALANPEGVDVVILRATLRIVTASTGAATISIGVAANGTTSATDIFNAITANGAVTGWYNGFVMQNGAKTAISAPAVWESSKYVTLTGSASTAGFSGVLYLEYIRA